MRRRRFLVAVGLAGAALSASGCQDGGDGGQGGADVATTVTATRAGPTVEERIAAAADHLGAAADELDAALDDADLAGERAGDFDPEPVEQRLAEARAELDAARGEATADQRETIEALEGAVEGFEAVTDVVVEMQGAVTALDEADRRLERERWAAAGTALERAGERISAATARLEEARSALESIDADRVERLSGVETGALERDLEEVADLLAALEQVIAGMREAVRGMEAFEAGGDAVDAEAWGRAAEEFGVAVERFAAAEDHFEGAEGSGPPEFQARVSKLVCQWRALHDGTERLKQGAEAADEGDTERARAAFEAADEAIAAGEQCGEGAE